MLKRNLVLAVLLSAACVTGAFAQVTVSGGFALSTTNSVTVEGFDSGIEGDVGVGANIYADFLLPIGVPLSLGFELGYDVSKLKLGLAEETLGAVPLLLRAAYHFDLMANLDLYVVGKIGYAVGTYSGSGLEDIGGVAFGFDVGAAYYFTPTVGVFAEGGFDDYALEAKIAGFSDSKVKASFFRFLTAGISLKL